VLLSRFPRAWSDTLEQWRRDATMLRKRIAGQGAPPLVPRGPRAGAAGFAPSAAAPAATATTDVKARVDSAARELRVARVVRETADAVTLVLRDPGGALFDFLPGQFFTVLTDLTPHEIVPRNYSASNEPGGAELHLTVKRKAGGKVSSALVQARAGDRLRVLGPFGAFVVTPDAGAARRLVLVAGGSGITPLASIARTVLTREPASEVALVYANRSEADVIFADELDVLARGAHAARFRIAHVLEDPAGSERELAATGRLDQETAARVLESLPLAADPRAAFYVCGPDPMRDAVVAALTARGVRPDAIKVERFTIGPRPVPSPSAGGAFALRANVGDVQAASASASAPRRVTVRIKGRTYDTTALPGATLLDAGLAAGAPMPFSCAAGGCGACRVRLVEGEVELEEPHCLSEAERAEGYVLTCVGRPVGPCMIEVESAGDKGGA